jgi:hypothetical protein
MPGYTLVPVDYQPDFEGVSLVPVDYDPFAADGPIQQAGTQPASQPQPNGFDQPPSAPQTPGSAPPLSPIMPNDGQAPSVPQPGQDPHSQYQALRPMLGDRNAMLATVYPEVRQVLIAQALAGQQQPSQASEPAPTGGVSGVTQQAQAQTPTQPAQPQPQTQPQQPAAGAGQPGVNGPATGNSPSGSGGGAGVGNAGSDPGNPTWAQDWLLKSTAFDDYSYLAPTEPLTDDQLALRRQKIVEAAQKQIGSTDWDTEVEKGNFPKGTNKCNLFVHEILTDAGASPGLPNGRPYWKHYPPAAGQWADPSYAIPGWRVLGPGESPQPGDVAAQPGNYTDATGHVVIVGPNNTFIGVGPRRHAPEKIESIPKKDDIVTLPAKGPLLYRRFVG